MLTCARHGRRARRRRRRRTAHDEVEVEHERVEREAEASVDARQVLAPPDDEVVEARVAPFRATRRRRHLVAGPTAFHSATREAVADASAALDVVYARRRADASRNCLSWLCTRPNASVFTRFANIIILTCQ
jgi:hypothetical protein